MTVTRNTSSSTYPREPQEAMKVNRPAKRGRGKGLENRPNEVNTSRVEKPSPPKSKRRK